MRLAFGPQQLGPAIGWIRRSGVQTAHSNAGSKLRPKVLQHVAVPVIENHVCESWHRKKGIDIRIYDEMMCAGYDLGQRDACQVSVPSRPGLGQAKAAAGDHDAGHHLRRSCSHLALGAATLTLAGHSP